MRRTRLWILFLLLWAPVRAEEGDVRLLTDDAIPRYLQRGQELARAEQWDKMIDVLQRVITGDPEIFPDLKREVLNAAVHTRDGVLYYPARELAIEELAKLPPDGLQVYRATYDPIARRAFEQAAAVVDLDARLNAYAQVYDAYLPSSVGDDALEAAADIDLLLGRHYEALALLRRLLELYPRDTDRDIASARAKAAYCAARIGARRARKEQLDRLEAEHPRARILIEGRRVPVAELREHPALRVRGAVAVTRGAEWPTAGGAPSRARTAEDLPPPEEMPARPLWSFRLAQRDARMTTTHGRWLPVMHDREEAPGVRTDDLDQDLVLPYPVVRPVVSDGVVFYKDGDAFVARRAASGAYVLGRTYYPDREKRESLGRDAGALQPLVKVRPGVGRQRKDGPAYEAIYRYLDYGDAAVAVEGDYLVTLENDSPPRHLRKFGELHTPGPGIPNALTAYGRASGKTLWRWDQSGAIYSLPLRADPELLAAWKRDREEHLAVTFRGPGLVVDGILYTVAQEDRDKDPVSLWALDIETGRVLFRTQLHFPDEMPRRTAFPTGAGIAVEGGLVFVATGAGVVAAVDALPPGRVRWIRRYRRNLPAGNTRAKSALRQGFAYGEPLVSGGKVIVAPVDGTALLALDAESGRLAWRVPRGKQLGKVAHIVGVGDGVVVLAGAGAAGVDLASGEVLWRVPSLGHWPFGRGFVGRRYAYIPAYMPRTRESYVHAIELRSPGDGKGRVKEASHVYKFEVEALGNLVFAGGRLIAANAERVACFTTVDAERARIDAALAQGGEKAELRLERALVALAAVPPLRAEARTDLRLAREHSRAEDEIGHSVRVRAIENLIALAIESGDPEPLAEARAIAAELARSSGVVPHPYETQVDYTEISVLAAGGHYEETLEAFERFLDTHAGGALVLDRKIVSAEAAARRLRERLHADEAFRAAFEARVRRAIDEAVARADVAALEAIPARYDLEPPSEEAFLALARLHETKGDPTAAEIVLRRFLGLAALEDRPVRALAHLELARLLVARGFLDEARAERDNGVARLDEEGRRRHAERIARIDRALAGEPPATMGTALKLPLRETPLEGGTPVRIAGDVPPELADLLILADAEGYAAYDGEGVRLWSVARPAGAGVSFGPPGDPATQLVAAAVARARFARFVGTDLVIADVFGITKVRARSGEKLWQIPKLRPEAAGRAETALEDLRSDLARIAKEGDLSRRSRLPLHTRAGGLIVRADAREGIEAYDLKSGGLVWSDHDIEGPPVGPPQAVGQLLVVGYAKPAAVYVYESATGRPLTDHVAPTKMGAKQRVLLAPPVLDPLGRLFVVTGTDEEAADGRLEILNARTDEPARPRTLPVRSRYAAILYADGRLLVFHDGGSGGANLHFLDLVEDTLVSIEAEDLLRDYDVVRDGGHLFVLTGNPGQRQDGARLFRIDLGARETLAYERPPLMEVYAPPVLTRRYVALAGSAADAVHVWLFEREASKPLCPPSPVFPLPGEHALTASKRLTGGPVDFGRALGLAAGADFLAAGGPPGAWRLQGTR